MLDYDRSNKLYLVKRVNIPVQLLECERETISQQTLRSASSSKYHQPTMDTHIDETDNASVTSPRPEPRSGSKEEGDIDAGSATDVLATEAKPIEGRVSSGKLAKNDLARRPLSGGGDGDGGDGQREAKEKELEAEDGSWYWLPRIRVMFAAEDPRAFANRVAHAHMSR